MSKSGKQLGRQKSSGEQRLQRHKWKVAQTQVAFQVPERTRLVPRLKARQACMRSQGINGLLALARRKRKTCVLANPCTSDVAYNLHYFGLGRRLCVRVCVSVVAHSTVQEENC